MQGITTRVLKSVGFEGWMEKGGIKQFFDRSQTSQTPVSILGKLVFWLVFFIAISMAVFRGFRGGDARCVPSRFGSAPVSGPTGGRA